MKRGSYIILCLISIFLMLMLPNVNAVEYTTVEKTIEEKFDWILNNPTSSKNLIEGQELNKLKRIDNLLEQTYLINILSDENLILIQVIIGLIMIIIESILYLITIGVYKIFPKFGSFFASISGFITGALFSKLTANIYSQANSEDVKNTLRKLAMIEFVILELWVIIFSKIIESK